MRTPPTSVLLFFFQSSRPHRDLHSFPTRRSSDLTAIKGVGLGDQCALITDGRFSGGTAGASIGHVSRSEEHTSELQSHHDLVCRLLLEKKKKKKRMIDTNMRMASSIVCAIYDKTS